MVDPVLLSFTLTVIVSPRVAEVVEMVTETMDMLGTEGITVTTDVWIRVVKLPVTVIVKVPLIEVVGRLTVRVDEFVFPSLTSSLDRLNVAVGSGVPVPAIAVVSVTFPVNPLTLATVTVAEPALPGMRVRVVGFALMLKSLT